MALKDYLKKNGLGGLANCIGQPLTFKLSADQKVRYGYAKIKDTETAGKFDIDFAEATSSGAVAVTKDFAFVSFNTVYDTDTSKYTYTNKTIKFVDTEEATPVEVTDVLLIADAQAQGIDVSEATGPTITVTRNRSDWTVVSCIKEVIKNEVVYDGSKAVTVNLF